MKINEVEFKENLEKFRNEYIFKKFYLDENIHNFNWKEHFPNEYYKVVKLRNLKPYHTIDIYFNKDNPLINFEDLVKICRDVFEEKLLLYRDELSLNITIYTDIDFDYVLEARKYKLKLLDEYGNK